jgi:NADH:ubiquinone reductase (H+-translocating)
MHIAPKSQPHIVVIGAGFGGLAAAKALKGHSCQVTLIDKQNHHLFQPLLYQVATAGLASPAIAAPVRHIFRNQDNVQVLLGEVIAIDPLTKTLRCSDGSTLAFDALILAAGASHSYFGRDEWAVHAPGLKTLEDAQLIRKRVLLAFEHAELRMACPTEAGRMPPSLPLRFIVIGAGPTGVEMAGTMAEIARHTLKGEFRHIDPGLAEVLLIEGGPRVLPSFDTDLSDRALAQLQRLGVRVLLNTRVTDVRQDSVQVLRQGQSEEINSDCTVWAAGVQACGLTHCLGVDLDRAGRVAVEPTLLVSGLPKECKVYAVGDLATACCDGKTVPGVSPAAKQMGRLAALNALAQCQGRELQFFRYRDYGSLATIGRNAAIAQVGPFKLSGLFAWLFWLFVHIFFLIGFKNRLLVMAEWAWSYVSFARAARIVAKSSQ